jgi:hypothetical protein
VSQIRPAGRLSERLQQESCITKISQAHTNY